MGENAAWPIGKKLPLVLRVREERGGNGGSRFLPHKLSAKVPVWAARIERIEDQIAAFWVVELAHKIHGRVVNDGALSALLYLAQDLPDCSRFTAARVAHKKDVARLQFAWNPVAGTKGQSAQKRVLKSQTKANAIGFRAVNRARS